MLDAAHSILEPAGESDVPALARLWNQAFPGDRTVQDRERSLLDGGIHGGLDDVWVSRVDGRMAGALRTYRMRVHLWGRSYPVMGLGAVAVAPDFRRQGVGGLMCTEAVRLARDRGDVLSLLYPFRVSYYRRFGYTLAGELHRYRFSPHDLHPFPGDRAVEWGSAEEDEDEVRRVYARVAERSNGLIDRTDRAWRFLRDPDRLVFLFRPDGEEATGYLVARPRKRREGAELRVRELVAEDRAAYEGLLGWIAAQGDQWRLVTYDALPSEGFQHHLAHPRRPRTGGRRGLWFESGGILRGPMIRILDVARVLADAGVSEVTPLRIEDEQLAENDGLWEVGDEARRVEEGDGGLAGEVRTLGVAEVADLFVRGVLGSRAPHPAGWEPAIGIADFRLLDEF